MINHCPRLIEVSFYWQATSPYRSKRLVKLNPTFNEQVFKRKNVETIGAKVPNHERKPSGERLHIIRCVATEHATTEGNSGEKGESERKRVKRGKRGGYGALSQIDGSLENYRRQVFPHCFANSSSVIRHVPTDLLHNRPNTTEMTDIVSEQFGFAEKLH